MDSSHLAAFLPFACAGFGLFLAGAANLLLLRKGVAVRALATAAGLGVGLGAGWALNQPAVTAETARLLGVGVAAFVLLSWGRLVGGFARAVASLRRTGVRFGVLAAGGIAMITGAIAQINLAEQKAVDESTAYLELIHGRVPTVPSAARAATDQGTVIVLKEAVAGGGADLGAAEEALLKQNHLDRQVIPLEPPNPASNCHGWVFTRGRYCLNGDDVELILRENGYQQVPRPRPGDLVIYRTENGIAHTARVEYVTDGKPVLAVSKWGNLGVFLHPIDKTTYGTDYAFYRTSRSADPSNRDNDHLLAGLGGPTAMPTALE